MSTAIWLIGATPCVVSRGVEVPDFVVAEVGRVMAVQRLPTETVGMTYVTFDGVSAASEIRVFLPDASEVAGVESCDANQVLSWGVYASGNANNTVRIVIIHPNYRIKEFTYTSRLGEQSIPVQQESDKWYSNP